MCVQWGAMCGGCVQHNGQAPMQLFTFKTAPRTFKLVPAANSPSAGVCQWLARSAQRRVAERRYGRTAALPGDAPCSTDSVTTTGTPPPLATPMLCYNCTTSTPIPLALQYHRAPLAHHYHWHTTTTDTPQPLTRHYHRHTIPTTLPPLAHHYHWHTTTTDAPLPLAHHWHTPTSGTPLPLAHR